jgi:acyl-coenzyme A synthetase/AMP-(fatty) acid ligase
VFKRVEVVERLPKTRSGKVRSSAFYVFLCVLMCV